jgi:protein phosphatase 2C family protein 2/3
MGQTLEKPALTKDTHTGSNEYLTYGISGMQGYRLTMEDAHNHISKVEVTSTLQKKIGEDVLLSFFGVYDGHSGSEAAQYLSTNLLANLLRDGEQGDIFSDETIKKTWLETDLQLEKWTVQEGTYPGSNLCYCIAQTQQGQA